MESYYSKHKEQMRAYQKKYREEHKEHILELKAKAKAIKVKNGTLYTDKDREYKRRYYLRHRDRILAYNRQRQQQKKEQPCLS